MSHTKVQNVIMHIYLFVILIYIRFLLPYERHVKGEEYKPMSVSERRRLKSKTNSTSDAETSEGTASESGKTTPVPNSNSGSATPSTPTTPVENKVNFPYTKWHLLYQRTCVMNYFYSQKKWE